MDEKFRQSLQQLHDELEQTQAVDPETRQLLEHLMNDIRATLGDSSGKPPRRNDAMAQRLQESIERLEESHPNLVLTLGRVLDHLARV
ncbi:MAG: DUF4404 family protein [Chloroflexi bacterium]|nr:DUF4404 family protein [Chloroflexota bacterium]